MTSQLPGIFRASSVAGRPVAFGQREHYGPKGPGASPATVTGATGIIWMSVRSVHSTIY